MSDDTVSAGGRGVRAHPLDLLWILLLLGVGALAWAHFFNDTPLPRPGDRLAGAELLVEFAADRPWKEGFPGEEGRVRIEDAFLVSVEGRESVGGPSAPRVRLRLRILERGEQRPDTLTRYRRILRRGATVVLSQGESEVTAEILEVRVPGEDR